MSDSRNKDLPDGVSERMGGFELGSHSVNWYKQVDGWHVIIQKEQHGKGKPGMQSMSNHTDPLKAYEEFKRVVRSIMTTTPAADII